MRNTQGASLKEILMEKAASLDMLSQHKAKTMWLREDRITEDLTDLLLPHSKKFFSPLRSIFLHQLKSVQVLEYFAPVLCRDGLLSLMHFFKNYPVPPSTKNVLMLVNLRFALFVPPAWESNVAFYKNQVSVTTMAKLFEKPHIDIYLILSIIDERQCTVKYTDRILTHIKKQIESYHQDSHWHLVIFFNNTFNNSVRENDLKAKYHFEMLLVLQKHLNSKLQFASWNSLNDQDLSQSYFFDLNELGFYYSDSYINHFFLSRGSSPLEADEVEPDFTMQASLYHSYGIYESNPKTDNLKKLEINKKISLFIKTPIFIDEDQIFDPKGPFFRGEKYGPLSFEIMIYRLGQEYLSLRNYDEVREPLK